MKKKELKKLALLGITGGVMFTSQQANAEAGSTAASGLLAASSWTCRGDSCSSGETYHSCNSRPSNVKQGNYQGHSGCGGKSGCGSHGAPVNKNEIPVETPNKPNTSYNKWGRYNPVSMNHETAPDDAAPSGCASKSTCAGKNGAQENGKSKTQPNSHSNTPNGHSVPEENANPAPQGPTSFRSPYANRNAKGVTAMTDSGRGGHGCGGKSGCGGSSRSNKTSFLSLNEEAAEDSASGNLDGWKQTGEAASKEAPITEEQFVRHLNTEGKAIFNTLSPEGKELAIRLSKQYADKNQAVKHAARQLGHGEDKVPAAKEQGAPTGFNSDKRQTWYR